MKVPRFAAIFSGLLFVSLLAACGPAAQCMGGNWGATWCAWQRTWHAPYPLETPLRDYYVPRLPGRCDRATYADGGECAGLCGCGSQILYGADSIQRTNGPYAPTACMACDPARFERLGQIPNDVELSVAAPTSGASR